MTQIEQKQIVMDAINAVSDKRLLNIITRLIYGILKNDDKEAANIVKRAAEEARA